MIILKQWRPDIFLLEEKYTEWFYTLNDNALGSTTHPVFAYCLGQNLTIGSTATGPGQYIATSPNPAAAAAYQAAAGIPAAAYATQHPGIMSPFTTGE